VKKFLLFLSLLLLVLFIVQQQKPNPVNTTERNKNVRPKTIEWIDLLPKDAVTLIQPAPLVDHSRLSQAELDKDKSAKRIQANIIGKNFGFIMQNTPNNVDNTKKMTLKDVLISTGVRRDFVNKKIRIAGYIVPLEFDDNHKLTAFFFAPYFGACTHVPPPSPNQLIYVRSPQGFTVNDIFDPFWLTGKLHIETTETDETVLGISSYSVDADTIEKYSTD